MIKKLIVSVVSSGDIMELWLPNATPLQDVLVAVICSILFIIIQKIQSRGLQNRASRSKFRN